MGRSRDKKLAEEFLQDVFAAEEFGKADKAETMRTAMDQWLERE